MSAHLEQYGYGMSNCRQIGKKRFEWNVCLYPLNGIYIYISHLIQTLQVETKTKAKQRVNNTTTADPAGVRRACCPCCCCDDVECVNIIIM